MDLLLKRKIFTEKTTIGELYLAGQRVCYILEDVDRGLEQSMSLAEIKKKKVYGETAIPKGRYKVVITMSPKYKRLMPILLNVPGYEGIRIHSGNKAEDTLGCLLPGLTYTTDWVNSSRAAYNKLYRLIDKAKQDVYIVIV